MTTTRPGGTQPHAKLTDETVAYARRRRREGATVRALADELGVGVSPLDRAIRGKKWSHVAEPPVTAPPPPRPKKPKAPRAPKPRKPGRSHGRALADLLAQTVTVPATGCMEWTGSRNGQGYGCTRLAGKDMGAHVASCILAHGPIPEGHLVRHSCDNPPCINPAHLGTGTAQDNSDDAIERDRLARGEDAPIAKLTDAAVAEMRRRFATGQVKLETLARRYGVNSSTAHAAITGRSWTHVEEAPVLRKPKGLGIMDHAHRKLTAEQRAEIVAGYVPAGRGRRAKNALPRETLGQIGARYGVSASTIREVVKLAA